MAMERTAVKSRDLAVVGYDQEAQVLEIAFRQGGVYLYQKVPQKFYDALMSAPSHGIYFNQNIKDQFQAKRVQ